YICDRIAVMYLGQIVELADAQSLYSNTLHPYTQALLSAIPVADLDKKSDRIVLQGDVPSPVNPPSGCTFHPRCPRATERCKKEIPALKRYMIDGQEHFASCHLVTRVAENQ
ncbi:MAG: oligopeptide/dipeptide ABC transporter ATP-binding protein, partial [Porticoccaceae bacterium]